ncbi:MAG: hypothetical protein AB1757_01715 [Acidobacteriota bacterium]
MHKRVLFTLLIISFLTQSNLSRIPLIQSNTIPADEYEFYSMLIRHLAGDSRLVVITDKTSGVGGDDELGALFFGEKFENLKKSNGFSEITEDTIGNYLNKPKKPIKLTRSFNLPNEYILISESSIDAFFKKKGIGGWDDFYAKYPNSRGYIGFSRVGFNQQKSQALVYAIVACGSRCMYGGYYFFVKQQNKWVLKGKNILLQA